MNAPLVNSCVLCSPVAQMVQLVSNSSLSLVLINHGDISVISKHGYFVALQVLSERTIWRLVCRS